MSEPLSSEEIEHVLAAVRRLVAPRDRAAPRILPKPLARLILSPAQRVAAPGAATVEGMAEAATPWAGAAPAQPDAGRKAAAVGPVRADGRDAVPADGGGATEAGPDAAQAPAPSAPDAPGGTVAAPLAAADPGCGDALRPVDPCAAAPAAGAGVVPLHPAAPGPRVGAGAAGGAGQLARGQSLPGHLRSTAEGGSAAARDPAGAGSAEGGSAAVDPPGGDPRALPTDPPQATAAQPLPEVVGTAADLAGSAAGAAMTPSGEDALLLAQLHDVVAQMVRAELRGALGHAISGRIRQLVRAEIARALALRDADSARMRLAPQALLPRPSDVEDDASPGAPNGGRA